MKSPAVLLARFLERAGPALVLTGAGVSTASGIPGYRDRAGNWQHAAPVQFQDFMRSEAVRRHYWAQSFAGWGRFAAATPNDAHQALVKLENAGLIDTLITQNVDGLHHRAGNRKIVDLHGRLDRVRCLSCHAGTPRRDWQQRLLDANPAWQSDVTDIRPDGDVGLNGDGVNDFRVPECDKCGGIVKPDVVFFGESVPGDRVEKAKAALARSGALLVIGSSLMVFSGFRFARLARDNAKPIAILNQGYTRADEMAELRLDEDCGEVLVESLRHLKAARRPPGMVV